MITKTELERIVEQINKAFSSANLRIDKMEKEFAQMEEELAQMRQEAEKKAESAKKPSTKKASQGKKDLTK